MKSIREFRSPDGVRWRVMITNPGATNAIVVFRHPDALTHLDRYAWYVATGPETRNVTARLDPKAVLERLDDRTLQRLYRSSYTLSEHRAEYRAV